MNILNRFTMANYNPKSPFFIDPSNLSNPVADNLATDNVREFVNSKFICFIIFNVHLKEKRSMCFI